MANVVVEEALGFLRLDVAVLIGIEERASVEDDQFVLAGHDRCFSRGGEL